MRKWFHAWGLCCPTVCVLLLRVCSAGAESLPALSVLDAIKQEDLPYIPQYSWTGGLNEPLTEELFREYLRMGFTGIQKDDHDAFRGVEWFLTHGLHGFMWQTYWWMPDLQLDQDGGPLDIGLYGCTSSERNIQAGVQAILDFIGKNRNVIFKLGGRYVLNSWDETGIQYANHCRCPLCEGLFREYLKDEIYHDDTPGQDADGDSRALNREAGAHFAAWDEIPLPVLERRFDEPVLWKHFMDFKAWKLARFLRRVEAEVNEHEPVVFSSFYHSTMYWPGMGPLEGVTPYHHARQSGILFNEFCIADWPVATIAAAWCDRLSREYGRGVYHYSWFWPGFRDGGKDYWVHDRWEYERALARKMGHALHGLLFWHYVMPIYNHLPEPSAEIAYWHHFLQKHWEFLKRADPAQPEIAVLWPGHASAFYALAQYPKPDFGWGPQALIEAQYPFTVVQEEEVEEGILSGYKVLYVFGVERTTPQVLAEMDRFIADGGYVFADADSLLMTVDGRRSDLLARRFGVDPKRKYKSVFWPTILSAGEAAWAAAADPLFGDGRGATDAPEIPGLPRETPAGLEQTALEPDAIHVVVLDPAIVPTRAVRTFHDIVTGVLTEGKQMGAYQGEPVAVETDRTVWFGHRPGWDMYAVFPGDILGSWGEPLYRNGEAPGWYDSQGAAERGDYRRVITYLAEKAGVQRPAVVTREGGPAGHVEVAVKTLAGSGARMVFLVNHEGIGGPHRLVVHDLPEGFEAWDVMNNLLLEEESDGEVELSLKPWRARVVYFGPPEEARRVALKQQELMAVDLSPIKFTVGPKTLPEPPLPEVRMAAKPRVTPLGEGEVGRMVVHVRNGEDARTAEPVVLPGRAVAHAWRGHPARGVSLACGEAVQWDDVDQDGRFSPADEIVWQTDLAAGEEKTFALSLLNQPARGAVRPDFALAVGPNEARVRVEDKEVFVVGHDNSWRFPQARAAPPTRHPGGRFFPSGEVKDADIRVLGDGPVRKLIEVSHGYLPHDGDDGSDRERDVETTARYAVYARPVPGEDRVYVEITHQVEKDYHLGKVPLYGRWYMAAGHLAGLAMGEGWYEDTLGRVGPLGGEIIEKNSGGWLAVRQGTDLLLGLLARRTTGIVAPRGVPDEVDGLQVADSWLMRSALNWNADDIRAVVDREIMAGNIFRLEAMLVLRNGDAWQGIDSLRRQYATPPVVMVAEWVMPEPSGLSPHAR